MEERRSREGDGEVVMEQIFLMLVNNLLYSLSLSLSPLFFFKDIKI